MYKKSHNNRHFRINAELFLIRLDRGFELTEIPRAYFGICSADFPGILEQPAQYFLAVCYILIVFSGKGSEKIVCYRKVLDAKNLCLHSPQLQITGRETIFYFISPPNALYRSTSDFAFFNW